MSRKSVASDEIMSPWSRGAVRGAAQGNSHRSWLDGWTAGRGDGAPRGEGLVLKVGWLQKTAQGVTLSSRDPPNAPRSPLWSQGLGDIVEVIVEMGAEK